MSGVPTVAWYAEEGADVARALGAGRAAHASTSGATPAIVYAASLRGDARVLGRYQREEDALAGEVRARVPVHRRATGGPTGVAGEGTLYVALALSSASALMECPRERVLNRNVRPLLSALRQLGVVAHYFGREFVSVERRPAALVAWTREPRGAVLIEALLGVERAYAVPEDELGIRPASPRMLGKEPITLAEAGARPAPRALAEALARACAAMSPLELEERAPAPPPPELEEPARIERWSSAREAPIGLLRAGLTMDARGAIEDAALAGDFLQDADAPARLRAALVGGLATPERLRDALNATYGAHGAVIEGLRSLQPALEGFLELAARG